MKGKTELARPVDAIHGARNYEITVGLCRPNGDYVELDLRNDRRGSNFYVTGSRVSHNRR